MPGYHFMLMLLLGASITAHVQVEAFASTYGIDINNAIYTRKKVPLPLYKYCLVSSSKLFSKRRTNRSRSDENNHEQSDGNVSKMPQLPPSSGRSSISTTTTSNVEDDPPLVSRKFQLSYTCKVCETRNTHMVSRIAYNNGVVVVTCKGCSSQHMIADNLGWSNHPGGFEGAENIEDFLNERGRGDTINRVDQSVWDFEQLLDKTDEGDNTNDVGDNKGVSDNGAFE